MECHERRKGIWVGWLVLAVCIGCRSAATESAGGDTRNVKTIVATTGMVADMVQQVVGDRYTVVALLGEGVDPHLYKPTSNDVKTLLSADIIFYNGLMLEGRMEEALQQVRRGGKPVFAVTDGLDRSRLRAPPQFAGHYDPHVWMDVAMWSDCVPYVAKVLSEWDPEGKPMYERHAARYRDELLVLDNYVRDAIASIPERQRVLVTAHDAFEYFSAAYGIPVKSAQGISTESDPGVNDINALVQFLVDRQVKAIFVETSVSQANLKAVIEGAAAQGWTVTIGGTLYSDAMGKAGTYEGTYIGMLDHNATVIARSLGGDVPPRGMQGRLSAFEADSQTLTTP